MSTNQLAPVSYEIAGANIELQPETVKNYLVSGNGKVTDQEVLMFMNLCQYRKLNPLDKEAYLIKFGQQPAQIIVSKEAFMKRAEAHENFEGFDAGIIYEYDGEMKEVSGAIKPKSATLLGGWCRVFRSDRKQPIEVKVSIDEFGKGQATWKEMPMNMIRKVAIVNALREAFPNTLGAMYSEDEAKMPANHDIPDYNTQRKDITTEAEIIDTPKDDEAAKRTVRSAITQVLKELGISGDKVAGYLEEKQIHLPKDPSLAQLNGALRTLEAILEVQKVEDSNDNILDGFED